jgi:hypothetical protein
MTADNCMFWSGEGCICEIIIGVRCPYQTKDFVSQCNATNNMLVDEEEWSNQKR